MSSLYSTLQEHKNRKEKRVLTVINGPHTGAKAFFAEDGLLWQHPENGFFTEQGEAAEKIRTSGQQELAGETVFCDCLAIRRSWSSVAQGHVAWRCFVWLCCWAST